MTERRRYLTPKQKAQVWEEQGCLCAGCSEPKTLAELDFDHRIPLWGGGTNDIENWQGLCRERCHREKTRLEATSRAKADRCRNFMETGKGRKRKGRPLKGRGFDPRWRRKMDGTVEARR